MHDKSILDTTSANTIMPSMTGKADVNAIMNLGIDSDNEHTKIPTMKLADGGTS